MKTLLYDIFLVSRHYTLVSKGHWWNYKTLFEYLICSLCLAWEGKHGIESTFYAYMMVFCWKIFHHIIKCKIWSIEKIMMMTRFNRRLYKFNKEDRKCKIWCYFSLNYHDLEWFYHELGTLKKFWCYFKGN